MFDEGFISGFISDKHEETSVQNKTYMIKNQANNLVNECILQAGINHIVFWEFVICYVISRYNNVNEVTALEWIENKCHYVNVDFSNNTKVALELQQLFNKKNNQLDNNEIFDLSLNQINIFVNYESDKLTCCDGINFNLLTKGANNLHILYNSARYSESMIMSLSDYITGFADYLSKNLDKEICHLSFLLNKSKVLYDFNNNFLELPNTDVIRLFQKRVIESPNDIAVIFNDKEFTFAELDRMSKVIAKYLKSRNIGKGDIVPVFSIRGIEYIAGVLGILRCGGAFLPIDSEMKLDCFLNEYNAKIILLNGKNIKKIDMPFAYLNEIILSDISSFEFESTEVDGDDIACCIYTSGTTGRPKGALLTHKGLLNAALTNIKEYEICSNDVILQYANYAYAQSIIEIFPALIKSKLCLLSDDDCLNFQRIVKVCNDNKVSVMTLTPSIIAELHPEEFKYLKLLDSTGETANYKDLNKWVNFCRVINSFGSTELTGNTSIFDFNSENDSSNVLIGKPVCNNEYYILDNNCQLCDLYMMGELYISGPGLSKGYLNDEQLSNEKFIYYPEIKKYVFKTGDIVRWRYDGQVEYFGRSDDQIKINGVRIDLNIIKNQIEMIEEVEHCCVIANTDDSENTVICAYIIGSGKVDVAFIRNELLKKLPLVMVPSFITQINEFPLNQNKKIDRRLLPKPIFESIGVINHNLSDNIYFAPFLEILKDVLQLKKINFDNTFIEIGGDSIKAMCVVNKLNMEGLDLKISELLKNQSLYNALQNIFLLNKNHNNKKEIISDSDIYAINNFYSSSKM